MKKGNPRNSADEPPPYGLKDLALFPTTLTLSIGLSTFMFSLGGGPDSFQVAGFLVLLCAVVFYSVTFIVGGLCLLVVWSLKRLTGPRSGSVAPDRKLWDDWIDGP